MRRTLTVLVTAAAFLAPAAAASADVRTNASCSNGSGGNVERTGATYSGKGNLDRASTCGDRGSVPTAGPAKKFGPPTSQEIPGEEKEKEPAAT